MKGRSKLASLAFLGVLGSLGGGFSWLGLLGLFGLLALVGLGRDERIRYNLARSGQNAYIVCLAGMILGIIALALGIPSESLAGGLVILFVLAHMVFSFSLVVYNKRG